MVSARSARAAIAPIAMPAIAPGGKVDEEVGAGPPVRAAMKVVAVVEVVGEVVGEGVGEGVEKTFVESVDPGSGFCSHADFSASRTLWMCQFTRARIDVASLETQDEVGGLVECKSTKNMHTVSHDPYIVHAIQTVLALIYSLHECAIIRGTVVIL